MRKPPEIGQLDDLTLVGGKLPQQQPQVLTALPGRVIGGEQ